MDLQIVLNVDVAQSFEASNFKNSQNVCKYGIKGDGLVSAQRR